MAPEQPNPPALTCAACQRPLPTPGPPCARCGQPGIPGDRDGRRVGCAVAGWRRGMDGVQWERLGTWEVR